MKTLKTPKAVQLPSGSWRCRVRIAGEDISIVAPTRKEAETKAAALKLGIVQAEKKEKAAPITLRKAIDQYIEAKKTALSPSTIRGYRTHQRCRLQGIMDAPLEKLTDSSVQKAINEETKSCSSKTLRSAWSLCASALKFTANASFNVFLPKAISQEQEFLRPAQIEKFLEAIKDTPVEIAALLGLHSLRRSEILGLRWEHVDLKKNMIYVRGATVFGEDNKLVNKPENKNKSSRRSVPIMTPQLVDALNAVPKESRQEFIVTVNPNTLWAQINRICRANDLPEIGVHGLRHSFCSLAYHLNIPEKIAMQIGGWSDFQTMRKIYTHIAEDDLQTAVTAMTDFFSSAK